MPRVWQPGRRGEGGEKMASSPERLRGQVLEKLWLGVEVGLEDKAFHIEGAGTDTAPLLGTVENPGVPEVRAVCWD